MQQIRTGVPVREASERAESATAGGDDTLFSPARPGAISRTFDVDRHGAQIKAAGLDEGMELQLEMLVGDVPTPVRLQGERQLLLHNNNILPITHPGRYRLRVTGSAGSSGMASVVIEHLRRWT